MTPETISKLEDGFLKGLSDREAALYANIAPSTLYAYCAENPDFSERKEELKENVKLQAKLNVSDKILIKKDISLSTWYLERKAKDEFSPRSELTGKDGKDLIPIDKEIKEQTDKVINEYLNGNTE